jgi:polysaccharide export outer membrane protein
MMISTALRRTLATLTFCSILGTAGWSPAAAADNNDEVTRGGLLSEYVLGPQDQLTIRVADLEEGPTVPVRIDPMGNIDLPLIGTVRVAGLAISDLRTQLKDKYKKYIHEPLVTVSVTEFHSRPVTVVGAVKSAGVHQIEGPKRLLEIISMAGGLTDDAGSKITITRELDSGPLLLPGARTDLAGRFTVAELEIAGLMASTSPSKNIIVRPNDVISVSAAELIYVMGEVKKPGGYTLHSHAKVSVLEALAMAEGPQTTAAPKSARVLRLTGEGKAREEIPTDVSRIIAGKSPDLTLQAYDILVIPNNAPRAAALRAVEVAVQLGTGVIIYRGMR